MITRFDMADVRGYGFSGFVAMVELRSQKLASVPGNAGDIGVYMVLRDADTPLSIVAVGTGGRFKGRDPNQPVSVLEANWVTGTPVVYIGKAGVPGFTSEAVPGVRCRRCRWTLGWPDDLAACRC